MTTRLCLDRLRARTPVPVEEVEVEDTAPDPADDVALADTVGIALQAVIDRLSPRERVAFVLHDSFGFEFGTIAAVLDTTPVAARKLASRARSKVAQPAAEDALADWEVVDAFMAAARGGDFERLLQLLAPDAVVGADEAAVLAGTPASIEGRDEVATFFNGSAQSALAVFVGDRPGVGVVPAGRGPGGLRLHRRPTARSAPSPSAPTPTSSPGSYAAPVPTRSDQPGHTSCPPIVRPVTHPPTEENP